ncbi:RecX family transcriptional regulator [Candidatus Microgenomates bacterium]|nr:RecX family transcriptional regulator [Candidatus Microgenomates bacterium]
MKITRLQYQKQDPNRVNVYVDDKFAVGLETNAVVKLGLFKGQEITQEELNKIISESDFGKKLNAALNFLSFRPRSEFEIRQFFRRKKLTDIEPVMEKLKTLGQIDDEAFAKWYVDQRQTFRPKGHRAIEMELRRKGIKAKVEGTLSEEALARKALLKFRGEKSRERQQRFLASRGFDWDTIAQVLKIE